MCYLSSLSYWTKGYLLPSTYGTNYYSLYSNFIKYFTPVLSHFKLFFDFPVGPYLDTEGKPQPELLKSCYETIFDLVLKHKIRSVALCSIATGFYGYPKAEASSIAIECVKRFLEKHENDVDKIVICVSNKDTKNTYKNSIARILAK